MTISEENRLYKDFADAGNAITPKVAVPSKEHWRHEGRPTAAQWYGSVKQPSSATRAQGDSMETTATTETTAAPKAPKVKGAKIVIRELYANADAAYTLDEMATATGKQKGSLGTAISDLKSAKYCAPGEPLVLHRWADQKYRLTEEPKPEPAQQELAPTAPVAEAPADALAD